MFCHLLIMLSVFNIGLLSFPAMANIITACSTDQLNYSQLEVLHLRQDGMVLPRTRTFSLIFSDWLGVTHLQTTNGPRCILCVRACARQSWLWWKAAHHLIHDDVPEWVHCTEAMREEDGVSRAVLMCCHCHAGLGAQAALGHSHMRGRAPDAKGISLTPPQTCRQTPERPSCCCLPQRAFSARIGDLLWLNHFGQQARSLAAVLFQQVGHLIHEIKGKLPRC